MHLKNHYQYSFHIILRNRDTHHGTLSTTEEQYYHKVKCLNNTLIISQFLWKILVWVLCLGSHKATIIVSVGAEVSAQISLGKDPLPNSFRLLVEFSFL